MNGHVYCLDTNINRNVVLNKKGREGKAHLFFFPWKGSKPSKVRSPFSFPSPHPSSEPPSLSFSCSNVYILHKDHKPLTTKRYAMSEVRRPEKNELLLATKGCPAAVCSVYRRFNEVSSYVGSRAKFSGEIIYNLRTNMYEYIVHCTLYNILKSTTIL